MTSDPMVSQEAAARVAESRDRPILFRAEMVRALLDGRKTQTRRPAWGDRFTYDDEPSSEQQEDWDVRGGDLHRAGDRWEIRKPSAAQQIEAGDRLWVREAFAKDSLLDNGVRYVATDAIHEMRKRHPSIHMPRWASRLTLAVTAVRIERLQDISDDDAKIEGARRFDDIPNVSPWMITNRWSMETPINTDHCLGTARFAFANYYNKIHGLGAWDANPEVVVITFIVHKANIDAVKKARAA